jgi:hypothetical protein
MKKKLNLIAPGTLVAIPDGQPCPTNAWVVSKENQFSGYIDYILLGWKPGEDKHGLGWKKSNNGKEVELALQSAGCDYGWWVFRDKEVEIISTISSYIRDPSQPDGMFCRLCGTFYHMAIPNRPDGKTLVCYSCRQGYIPSGI